MKKISALCISILFIFGGCGEKKIEFYGYEINSKIDKNTVEKGESSLSEYVLYTPKVKDKMFDEVKIYVDNEEKIKQVNLVKECKQSENPFIYQKEIINKLAPRFGEFSCKETSISEICNSEPINHFQAHVLIIAQTLFVSITPEKKHSVEKKSIDKF